MLNIYHVKMVIKLESAKKTNYIIPTLDVNNRSF